MPEGVETEDLNRLWLIVRYMKACSYGDNNATNRFTLRGGERIKVGRVIFTVKEIVNPTTRYIDASTIWDGASSSSETPGLLSQTDDG